MAGFATLLKRHLAELDRLQGAHADSFLKLLESLRETLTGRMVAMGDLQDPLNVWRLRAVVAETESGIALLRKKANGEYDAASQQAIEMSIDHMGAEMDALGSFNVSLDAAKVLADPAREILAQQFDTSVQRYGLDLLQGVRQRLFVGNMAGDSMGAVVRDIASERGPLGEVGEANAERLVRTETSNAYQQAKDSGFRDAKSEIPDLRRINIHLGSYKCELCNRLHGREIPSEGFMFKQGKKTVKRTSPPWHPNCACTAVLMRPSWKRGLENEGYLEQQALDEQPSL